MSVLELARKAYLGIKSRRNGRHEAPSVGVRTCEISELCEIRSEPASSYVPCEKSEIRSSVQAPDTTSEAGYLVVVNEAGLETVRGALEETTVVGLDTETTGLNPRTDRVRLLSLDCDTNDGGRFPYLIDCFQVDPRPLWEALASRPLILQNAVFDLQFLAALGFEPAAPVHDTMLLSQLLHGTRQVRGFHGLGQIAERELGREIDKAEQRSDWTGQLTPKQLRYAADDAAVLRPLYEALTTKLKAADLARVAEIEGRCLPAMAWLCRCGTPFDRGAWEALAQEAEAAAADLARRLDEAAPPRPGRLMRADSWNWSSPEQVKEAFAALGVTLESSDDDALAGVDLPLAELLREHRAASKRAGTYGLDWLKHVADDGRVYAGWRQVGADSGRQSCSDPNLQNLPRDVRYRRCFAAPPGRTLVKGDYSQIELRIAAKIADDRAMLDAYGRGEDLHIQTARMVLGLEVVTKQHRQLAKALNFGLLFGMGSKGFRIYARSQYGVDLTEQEATHYRAAFFEAYPGLARWHAKVRRARAKESRTLAGRRRLFDDKTPDTWRLNSPVQGTGADGLKLALALLWERRADCPGAFPVLTVHDEIVVEADADKAEAAKTWLVQAMVDGMAPLIAPVPCVVDASIGRTWAGD
jgi:DNA polymerase I